HSAQMTTAVSETRSTTRPRSSHDSCRARCSSERFLKRSLATGDPACMISAAGAISRLPPARKGSAGRDHPRPAPSGARGRVEALLHDPHHGSGIDAPAPKPNYLRTVRQLAIGAAPCLVDAQDQPVEARAAQALELARQVLGGPEAQDLDEPALCRTTAMAQLEVGEDEGAAGADGHGLADHVPVGEQPADVGSKAPLELAVE